MEVVQTSTPDVWRQELSHFRSLIGGCGLSVPPSSRIEAFARGNAAFEKKEINARQLGSARLHELLEGFRDFSELYVAARALLPTSDSIVISRFREALGGSATPTDANRIARTSQFELYLGGLFSSSGARVEFAEPDLIVTFEGIRLGVAAKRIENVAQFPKRLRSGALQLSRAGLRGIVAISFDGLEQRNYPGMIGSSLDAISDGVEPLLSTIVEPLRARTFQILKGRPVVALMACVVFPAVVPSLNQIGRAAGTVLRVMTEQASNKEQEALVALTKSLRRSGV